MQEYWDLGTAPITWPGCPRPCPPSIPCIAPAPDINLFCFLFQVDSTCKLTLHGTSRPSHWQDWWSTKCSRTNQGKLEGVVVNLLVEGDALQQIVPAMLRLVAHQEVLMLRTLQFILAALPPTTVWHHRACSAATIHITHCWSFKVNAMEDLIGCNV